MLVMTCKEWEYRKDMQQEKVQHEIRLRRASFTQRGTLLLRVKSLELG